MNKAGLLAQVPLFAGQRPEDLERFAALTVPLSFPSGKVIVEENTLDKRLFVILKGRVEVVKGLGKKRERRLQVLGPLNHFGEMALIENRERSASVVAATDTETLCIDRFDFGREIRSNPELALGFLKSLSLRLRTMNVFVLKSIGTLPPMCMCCRKIYENDRWVDIETYIEDQSDMEIQQTICPQCSISRFPQFYAECKRPSEREA
ncbi:MAG: cyclic nucleotide-binding domain-containing protein [Desulfobacterales bacterium]|jgi:CRP-like cAMP-binding protein